MTTPLILTGLAVAFAFRCGMFNIGGQGQYAMGAITAVWVGTTWADMPGIPHAFLAIVLAMLVGALWAGIAGILKATVGAHEVITTIMLNWIAYWFGTYAFGLGGPLQNDANKSVPISNDVFPSVKLPVWWGNAELQGLHIGFFIALAALVAYWFILNRTTLGYEVRAVGYNPEAARYAGINVARSYFLAMAIAGVLRRARRRARHPRLAVPAGLARHPDLADRVHRHRGRAARAQHGDRRRPLRAACSARSSTGRRRGASTPTSSRPSSPGT